VANGELDPDAVREDKDLGREGQIRNTADVLKLIRGDTGSNKRK
jgi:hypothetical protein